MLARLAKVGVTGIDGPQDERATDDGGGHALSASEDNVTDEEGLTEGDPRNPASPNGRFIMPRSVELSLGYEF